jgi:hypothetical protein
MNFISGGSTILSDSYNISDNNITQIYERENKKYSLFFCDFQTNILDKDNLPNVYSIYRTHSLKYDDYSYNHHMNDDYINKENEERIELLARKYCNKNVSNEETARLKILTNKIKNLIPLVSDSEYKALDIIVTDISEIKERNLRRKRKLDIK